MSRIRLAAAFLATLALGACATGPEPPADRFLPMAEAEFGAGFTNIDERYIEPLRMSELALSGMQGISKIDPKLSVTRDGNVIRLADGERTVAFFDVPATESPVVWADLTARVVEAGRADSAALGKAGVERIYEVVFDGALTHLDRFSRYAPAALARLQRGQRDGFGGIGVALSLDDGVVRFEQVTVDSPAARAGIEPGDVLLGIAGQPVAGLSRDAILERLRGPVDSELRLSVMAGMGGPPRDVTLRRELIIPATVSFERRGDVAYFRLSGFNEETTQSLELALARAKRQMGANLHGAVIDLRGNPGGLLDQAVTVADLFLARGRILSTAGRHPDSNQIFDAAGNDLLEGKPIVLLDDGNTASAAEVVAAALQDQRRAVVVGTSSYGKGTVQTVHRLPNDGEIVITWSRILPPSGYVLNGVGVIPDLCTSEVDPKARNAAARIVDTALEGHLETAAARASLRAHPRPTVAEIDAMRAACPPNANDAPLDLEVARELVDDATLYARSLEPQGAPEIAKSK
ncbi:MAG TPA: S41 family peptidase [Alphaproteobacteria bacterium]|nr:S41 family peptidase [Alphaproteobacteria bacterium]